MGIPQGRDQATGSRISLRAAAYNHCRECGLPAQRYLGNAHVMTRRPVPGDERRSVVDRYHVHPIRAQVSSSAAWLTIWANRLSINSTDSRQVANDTSEFKDISRFAP